MKKELSRKEKRAINKQLHRQHRNQYNAENKLMKQLAAAKTAQKKQSLAPDEVFLEAIENGLNMVEAEKIAVGYSLRRHYSRIDTDTAYAQAFARARQIANENRAEALLTLADTPPQRIVDNNGNMIYDTTELKWRDSRFNVAKWLLAVRDNRYSEKNKVDNTHSGTIATKIIKDDI